jgi:uncharacterized protein (TIGR02231 family)
MWKQLTPFLAVCGLATLLAFAGTHVPAQPQSAKEPAPAAQVEKSVKPAATAAPPDVKVAPSRVIAVTVYQNSALVTREVDVPEQTGTLELTVAPLPPTTVNSSLYTEGTDGIRVLTTRFRTRQLLEDNREDVRKLQDELKALEMTRDKLEAEIAALQTNTKSLDKVEGFTGITTIETAKRGALDSDSVIALSKYVREARMEAARELVGLKHQVRTNQEKAEFAGRRLKELAAGTARTEREAVIVVEKSKAAAGKVRLNYLVDAASWRPQYKFRAGKTAKDQVQLEYLAAVVQHTGEDWADVKLVLSTAQPMLNAAPPDLQTLQVTVVPSGSAQVPRQVSTSELEMQVKSLRDKAQRDFNEKKGSTGVGLYNTAAALDQSWELFNPEAAVKRGCALAVREGPTVTYHLSTRLTVPSRNDEQVLEVARLDLAPEYYHKAVPILTSQVYRLADLTNRSPHVLLPGDATMYVGSDFVGQMSLPLVATGETFTVGFGVDPQVQVHRQMTDRWRTNQGGNQVLRYEYRLLVSNFRSEPVKLQVWERLPLAEKEAVGVSLLKSAPDLSKDALYLREQRPNNLLRWDVTVAAEQSGEKALPITYEFQLELDRRMAISSFQSAGVAGMVQQPDKAPVAAPPVNNAEQAKIKAAMAKLSPEDRRLAEAQHFCAIDQDSPLGSMGPILKAVIKGQPVFLCCRGCEAEARAHPEETLASFVKLMARRASRK